MNLPGKRVYQELGVEFSKSFCQYRSGGFEHTILADVEVKNGISVKERAMGEVVENTAQFNQTDRYAALMDVVRNRMTNRAFAPYSVPREHFEMILEAARHAPSGANAQPWHYIVVTDPAVKQAIGQCFVDEQQHRARLHDAGVAGMVGAADGRDGRLLMNFRCYSLIAPAGNGAQARER